jgi:hypothetical protein
MRSTLLLSASLILGSMALASIPACGSALTASDTSTTTTSSGGGNGGRGGSGEGGSGASSSTGAGTCAHDLTCAAIPDGWKPIDVSDDGSCSAGWSGSQMLAIDYTDPLSCTCSCGVAAQPAKCTAKLYFGAAKNGQKGMCVSAVNQTVDAFNGCTDLSNNPPFPSNEVRLESVVPTALSCPAQAALAGPTRPSLVGICDAPDQATMATGCDGYCVTPSKKLCLMHDGDEPCPAGMVRLGDGIYDAVDDTRACHDADCSCDSPSPDCSGDIALKNASSVCAGATLGPALVQGQCTGLPVFTDLALSADFHLNNPLPAVCSPTAPSVPQSGDHTPSGTRSTICCSN